MNQMIWPLMKPSALNMSRLRELCLLDGVMVAQLVNNSTILLIGGFQDRKRTAKTWFFNFRTKEWTQGPSMIEERYRFGCGLIKSINSFAAFGAYTATTEIVNLPGGSFQKGKNQCLFD